jgi:mono/diheme cytochrome c family protein
MTEEWIAPGPQEVGAPLRAAGLVGLHTVAPETAAFHAVRLLHDSCAEPMSGEPALTAARVLGALGRTAPLYAYAIAEHRRLPEVAAEAFRHLGDLPVELIEDLCGRVFDADQPGEQVGLLELLAGHPDGDQFGDAIVRFLLDNADPDVFGFAVATLVASHRKPLLDRLVEVVAAERRPDRGKILLELLAGRTDPPDLPRALAELKERLTRRGAPRVGGLRAAFGVALWLSVSAACRPDPTPAPADLYDRFCAVCHAADGWAETSANAPALAEPNFLATASDEFLAETIARGRPGTTMTTYAASLGGPLADDQISAIVGYIRQWGPYKAAAYPAFDASGGSAAAGAAVYEAMCAECHGDDGVSLTAPDLANEVFQTTASDAYIASAVTAGRGERMPAADLGADVLADLVAYVRALPPPPARAP